MNPLLHYWEYGRHESVDTPPQPSSPLPSAHQPVFGNAAHPEPPAVLSAAGTHQGRGPLFSILLPTFNTPRGFLRLALESVEHDDELEPDALMEVARKLAEDPSLEVLYTDQDYVNVNGDRTGILLKPDWSPEMFRGVMYVPRSTASKISNLCCVYRKEPAKSVMFAGFYTIGGRYLAVSLRVQIQKECSSRCNRRQSTLIRRGAA